jgi:hypothetical protein
VPIAGNKGIMKYRHLRELQELKSNYSVDSFDDDKLSHTFISNPKMTTVLHDIRLFDKSNNFTIKEEKMNSTKNTRKKSLKLKKQNIHAKIAVNPKF